MRLFERYKSFQHKTELEKINQAGSVMAHAVHAQIEHGHVSPFEMQIKNPIKHLPDESFLLRSTKRAVEELASMRVNEELPLYDEASTLLANQETEQQELIVIFTRPSEA